MMKFVKRFYYVVMLSATLALYAGDLTFSDPSSVTPMPAWAVGQANRAPDLDALPGFQKPPPGFGVVPFFWWLGDPLTKERLGWILDQMDGFGMSGYQINYAHSDKGGRSFGFTYPSEPALFSENWWKLTGEFMNMAKKQGAGISLSDYTLGFGQGWFVDEILREHPEVNGMVLKMGRDGIVIPEKVPWSLNPMHPLSGKWYAEKFFGQFERRFPGEGGKGLNFFFSDELGFGVSGRIWSEQFADEFKKRKGYDITPELPALFKDIGPRTPKIRLDYSDVMVALCEESFFKPVFDWHQQRGMTMGCDHGGRGQNVVEFGDYFRTQRWNQGPGADQPGLGKNLIKSKVAASIAHLYQRPRVWLEGYYSSGWGTTSAGVVDATFADFVMGYNLLSFHGMYYATHGGWWEWAPPDNTFRMPYWQHLRGFATCVQRLSYLFTEGHHRCDVAILYPVAPMEAGMDGKESVQTAFNTAKQLYAKGVDFDFMDFESLDRAKIVGQELHVSGEIYRVLVLPAMKAIRHSTLTKAVAFQRAGGIVLAIGALPIASDRVGLNDPEVAAMAKEIGLTTDIFTKLPPRDYDGPGYIQHRKLGSRDLYAIYNAPKDTECFFRATGKVELWDPWTGATRPLAVTSQTATGTKLKLPLTEKEIQLIVFTPGQPLVAASEISNLKSQIPVEGDWEFELQPTSDNRFGDFHWPPTPTKIGAEVRQLWYCEGDNTNGPWRNVTCSFGPQFWKLGPLPANVDADAALGALKQVDPSVPVKIGGKSYRWQPYEFSWRYGIEGNPGHQGYHGLKENVSDNFIGLGGPARAKNETAFGPEPGGTRYYLWTSVPAGSARRAQALAGAIKPSAAWLNHEPLAKTGTVQLHTGANPLLLRYDKPGRTFFVVGNAKAPAEGVIDESQKTAAPSAVEAIFSPAAFWIWSGNQTGERCFQKTVTLEKAPAKALLRVTADDGYTAKLNGKTIGSGADWLRVLEFDVTAHLRTGANTLEIAAHNRGGPGGMIAELTLTEAQGTSQRIATDAMWISDKKPAQTISAYAGSLWATHQNGPPHLDVQAPSSPITKPADTNDDADNSRALAMRWHNNPDILPFDVRANEKTTVGWYRFVAPPGLRAMTVKARGNVQAWVDGKPITDFKLSQPTTGCVPVLFRIEQERGCYAGAALPEYIKLDCGPGRIELGDWSKIDGLLSYSGGAWYRKTVTIPAAKQVTLNLGDLVASAEVRVNGQLAGIKVSPPWSFDITKFVKHGENRIEVLVCNTLANHYTTIPTRYRGNTTSGLLGPVQLEVTK